MGHRLAACKLFEGLDKGQLDTLEKAGEYREYGPSDTVFEEGDAGTHVYCVVGGRAEIHVELGKTGDRAPVHVCTEGSFFGEFVLFSDSPRSATVHAVKQLDIFAIRGEDLRAVCEADPACGYRVLDNLCKALVGRMHKTTQELRASLMW